MADKLQNLVCPITFSFFVDPVVAEDGHTYERKAITDWIQRNGTSPLTREPITLAGLRPNHIVKCLVNEFQSVLSKRNYKFKLGVDIERSENPLFETTGKILYEAKWIGNPNGPPIALLILQGARAEKEASFYEYVTRHPNIVYTYGLVEYPHQHLNDDSDTFVALLQEMAPLRNLHNVLKHRVERHPNKPFSADLINQIFLQITDAMIFLSKKNIIHGDLACRNVLVFRIDETEPKQTLVKLTDFGISRGNTIYSKIEAIATVIDTVPIRSSPPEVLQNNDNNTTNVYSEKSDMYAMGVLMWEIYSNGNIPWGKIAKESDIRQKVINGERLSRPENCKSDRQWELILKCMSQAPSDRPTFVELKKQLTESIIPLTTTNKQSLCQSVSMPRNLTVIREETDDTPRSSMNTTEQSDSDNCYGSTTSLKLPGVDVKYRRSFFEKQIDQNARPIHKSRSEENIPSKSLSSKKMTNENIPPREDLIKLTKWH